MDFEEQIRKIQKNKVLLGQQSKDKQINVKQHIEQFPKQIIGLKTTEVIQKQNSQIIEQRRQPRITDSTQQAIRLLSSNFTLNKNGMMINKEIKPETAAQIQFYPNDRVLNLKISTVEKLRLLKRNEITKSMKFIRCQGKHLLKIREHMRKYYEYQKANEQRQQKRKYSSLQIENPDQSKLIRQQTSLMISQRLITEKKQKYLLHSQSTLQAYGNKKEQFQDKLINELNHKNQFNDEQPSRNFASREPNSNINSTTKIFLGQFDSELKAYENSGSCKKIYLQNQYPNKQFSNSNSVSSQSLSRTIDFRNQGSFEKKLESQLGSFENDISPQKTMDKQLNSENNTDRSASPLTKIFQKTNNILQLKLTGVLTPPLHDSNNRQNSASSHTSSKSELITKIQLQQEFSQIQQNKEEEYDVEDSSNESVKPESQQKSNKKLDFNDDCQRFMTQVDETTDENHESESIISKTNKQVANKLKSRTILYQVQTEESQQSQQSLRRLSAGHELTSDAGLDASDIELNYRLHTDSNQQLQKESRKLKQNKFAQKNQKLKEQEEQTSFSQNSSQSLDDIDNNNFPDKKQNLKIGNLSQISEEPENDFDRASGLTINSNNLHHITNVFLGGSMKNLHSVIDTKIQQNLEQNSKIRTEKQNYNGSQSVKFQSQKNINQNLQTQPEVKVFYEKNQLNTAKQSKNESEISNTLSSLSFNSQFNFEQNTMEPKRQVQSKLQFEGKGGQQQQNKSFKSLVGDKQDQDQNFELQKELEEFMMPQLVFKKLGDTSGSLKRSLSQSPTDHEQFNLNSSNFHRDMKQNVLNEVSKINEESSKNLDSELDFQKKKESDIFSFQKFPTESQKIFQVQLKRTQDKNEDSSSELAESYDSEAALMFGEIFTGSQTKQKIITSSSQQKMHEIYKEEQPTMSLIDNPEVNFNYQNQPQQSENNLYQQSENKNEYYMEEEEEELVSDDESEKISAQEYFETHIFDLFNNVNHRRDDFIHGEQDLDDLEEFYLSQVEQQCHADQITKLAKQEIILWDEFKLLKSKSELNKKQIMNEQLNVDFSASSSVIKGIFSCDITPNISENNSEKKLVLQKANSQQFQNLENSNQKLMELKAKIQKQEISKKQFAFNLNSNENRKLSDHDLFKNVFNPLAQLSPMISFNHSSLSITETQQILSFDFIGNNSDLNIPSSFHTALKDQSNQQTLRQGKKLLKRPSLKKSLVRPILKIAKSQLSLKNTTQSNLRRGSLSVTKEENSPVYKPFDTTQNKLDSFQFEFEPLGREVEDKNSISSQTLSSKKAYFQQWSMNQIEQPHIQKIIQVKQPQQKRKLTGDNEKPNTSGDFRESRSLYGYQKKIDLVNSKERDFIRKNLRRILEVTGHSQGLNSSRLQDNQYEEFEQQDYLDFSYIKNTLQSLYIKKQEKISLSLEGLNQENKHIKNQIFQQFRNSDLYQNKFNRILSYLEQNSKDENKIDVKIIDKKNTFDLSKIMLEGKQPKIISSKKYLSVRVSSSTNNQEIYDKQNEQQFPQRFSKLEQSIHHNQPHLNDPQTTQFPQSTNFSLQPIFTQNQEELKLDEDQNNQEDYEQVNQQMTFNSIQIPRQIQQSQIPQNQFQIQMQINPQLTNVSPNQSARMSQFLSFNLSGTQSTFNEQQNPQNIQSPFNEQQNPQNTLSTFNEQQNSQIFTQGSQLPNNQSNAKRGRQTANQKNLQIPFRQITQITTSNNQEYNQNATINQVYYSQESQDNQNQNHINQREFINVQQTHNFQTSQQNNEGQSRNANKSITKDGITILSSQNTANPNIYYYLKNKQIPNFPSNKNYFRFSNLENSTSQIKKQKLQSQQSPVLKAQTQKNILFQNKTQVLAKNWLTSTSHEIFLHSPHNLSIERKSVKNEAARRLLNLASPKQSEGLKKLKNDMKGLYKAIEIKHGAVTSPFSQKNNRLKTQSGITSYLQAQQSGFSSQVQAFRHSFFSQTEALKDNFLQCASDKLLHISNPTGRNQVSKTMVSETKAPELFVYSNQLAQTIKQPISSQLDTEQQKRQQFLREWKPKGVSRNHIRAQTMTNNQLKQ